MRTVIQTIGAFPSLVSCNGVFGYMYFILSEYVILNIIQVDFIMEILSRLVTKQVSITLLLLLLLHIFIYKINDLLFSSDMEESKAVGRILEMCSANKTSIFRGSTSGNNNII